ncbi:MAG: SWIM zinc finger family protein [candidate division Zixibacteria bacterium]|nr:SWIM zinc finger family protein [candidate division Zixibacteria bacterium]
MKPTIDQIRELCTESSSERGLEYLRQGRVTDLEQFGNKTTAIVAGASDYRVTIRVDKKDIKASCTCPYDWGGYCKHIAATLLALSEDYHKIRKKGKEEEQKIEAILNGISLDELKSFLMTEFAENHLLREHFAIYFSGTGAKRRNIHDYKKEINSLYREVSDRHGYIKYGMDIDFSYIHDLAQRYIKAKNSLEAATIYKVLAEVIAKNMDNVDDSDGYYGGEFAHAIENLAECINNARLNPKEKRTYIDYLFDKYIKNDPDYFQQNYDYALREICQSRGDLEYWKGLPRALLPEDLPDPDQWIVYYHAKELVMMQLHILDKLDEEEGFYNLIERYYHKDHEFCLLYARRKEKDGKTKEAVKVAEEGLSLFPDHLTKELRRFLTKFYKKQSSEYKENLVVLFLQDKDWNDYEKLKKACSQEDWDQMLSFIISNVSNDRFWGRDIIIDIYLKERMFDQALEQVLAQKNLYTLAHYHKDLSGRYPEKYFNAYKELITPFADSKMGRPHYREIARYLRQMKQIKGFENERKKLVNLLKERYIKRPAFLDEVKRV